MDIDPHALSGAHLPNKLFIDGRWVEPNSGRSFAALNPATGETLGLVAEGDGVDVDLAVSAARRAFDGPWSRGKPAERQKLLLTLAELVERDSAALSELETRDMGTPLYRTQANVSRAAGMLRYYAGQATTIQGDTIGNSIPGEVFTYTLKEPIGVVGAIIPWNSPLTATVWKLGPALATGCTIVLKPAEQASLVSLRVAQLCAEAGVPDGVVNVVTGYGHTAGAALAAHGDVDKIAFTGSHFTGQKIVQASAGNLKKLSLELGGKSPDIVFADADLDAAVPGAAMAIFSNAGQVCSAGSRLFVEQTIYDEFTERLAAFADGLVVGNGLDSETQIGPLVSEAQFQRVSDYLAVGTNEGARAIAGGTPAQEGNLVKGHFIRPTVFAGVHDDMRIAKEEIFGPVVSAIPFTTMEEVVQRANRSIYALGGGVWTTNVKTAHSVARGLRSGSVWINCWGTMDPAVPFGGNKMSGYGRESGSDHVAEYLNVKAVSLKLA